MIGSGAKIMNFDILPNILYVDNDEDSCKQFSRSFYVKPRSYNVVCTSDVTKAVDLIDTQAFDLYVFEYCLPRITGPELCNRIRANDAITPIIIYSVLCRPIDREMALYSGANSYLIKPDEFYKLPSTIDRLLSPAPLIPRRNHSSRRAASII